MIRNEVISFLLVLLCANSAIAGNPVTVIYPVYHTDTDRIIAEIRHGIRNSQGPVIKEIGYDPLLDGDHLRDEISRLSDNDIVITLTNELERFIRASGFGGQMIDGVSSDHSISESTIRVGIEPLPLRYIDTLEKLSPGIERLIYFSPQSGGGVKKDDLLQITDKNHFDIEYISVNDLNNVMHELNDVLEHANSELTAIWLPGQILSISNNTVLKYVLREAWRKSFIVFTDSLDAVLRGLLFTLIPDYHAYGVYLGHIATDIATGDKYPVSDSIRYIDDVYLMLNQRFAIHLGVSLDRSVFNKYRIVVPAK